MTAKEILKKLLADGWYEVKGAKSGHRQLKHNQKPGKVTLPIHPGDVPLFTLRSIEKQAGIKLR